MDCFSDVGVQMSAIKLKLVPIFTIVGLLILCSKNVLGLCQLGTSCHNGLGRAFASFLVVFLMNNSLSARCFFLPHDSLSWILIMDVTLFNIII